jgi:hypothetical protein
LTPNNDKANGKRVKIGFSLLGALLIAVTALFVFGWLAEEVLEGDTQKFDAFVRNAVHQLTTPGLTDLMQAFSVLGSVAVTTALSLLAICAFVYFHHVRTALVASPCLALGARPCIEAYFPSGEAYWLFRYQPQLVPLPKWPRSRLSLFLRSACRDSLRTRARTGCSILHLDRRHDLGHNDWGLVNLSWVHYPSHVMPRIVQPLYGSGWLFSWIGHSGEGGSGCRLVTVWLA